MRREYMEDCPEYLESFLTVLRVVKNRSERTEEAYYIDIRTFLRYLHIKNGKCDTGADINCIAIADTPIEWLEQLSLSDMYEYLIYLKDVRCNSELTRARKTSALKTFFKYLYGTASLITQNVTEDLEIPKRHQSLPRYLTLDQSLDLLANIQSKNTSRDYCIITLFLNCGMRLSELVGLDMTDYSADNKTLRVLGKGNKERIIFLNEACMSALDAYIGERPKCDCKALFLSSRHKRIARRRVEQIVEEMLKKAGLSGLGISTHKLRHTAATLMYQHGGVDTLVLKDILGHKSVSTTEIYTHLSDSQLRLAAENSPLADIHSNKKTDE